MRKEQEYSQRNHLLPGGVARAFRICSRNLWKNRLYSSINIFGLGIGLACVLLVTLFVRDELSYDKFHENASRIFRLTTTLTTKDGSAQRIGSSGQVQGPAFKAAIPEVSEYVRMMNVSFNVSADDKILNLSGLYVDSSFMKVFSFPLSYGKPETALSGTRSVVLTEKTAVRLFGRKNVVGRILTVQDGSYSQPFIITGVAKDLRSNSSIEFELLLPFGYLEKSFEDKSWLDSYLTTFIVLHPSADARKVIGKFPHVFAAQANEQLQQFQKAEGFIPHRQFGLQPITDIHLNRMGLEKKSSGGDAGGISNASSLTYSYILIGIVGFILLMACINFINLSIGNSLKRAKEVGVRKVVGSSRLQIIAQFLFEAGILCLGGLLMAIVICELSLPLFNTVVNKQLQTRDLLDRETIITCATLLVLSIVLAGLYPAILLAKFNPKEVLYNRAKLSGGHWFGKALVVFQFSLAICLMVATIVYYTQMNFISKKDLGYNPSNILRVWIPLEKPKQEVSRIKQELLQSPAIEQVAAASDNTVPVVGGFPTKINGREVGYILTDIDTAFIPMLKLPLVHGRNFSSRFGTDKKRSAIVNEAFAKASGLENPVGQQFENTWGGTDRLTIVGVVKDYHYGSLKEKIHPQVMILHDELPFFWLRIHPGKRAEASALVNRIFKKYAPQHPTQFSFLEDDIDVLYKTDKQWQQIISYSAVLSIVICCIGLFGLSHLATAQRTKEIGVRKVLGASVKDIVSMLSKDVAILVLIAAIVAFPIAWFAMTNWLQDFAYRVTMSWWFFFVAGITSMLIALMTVSLQAVKAAIADPVKSLRTE